MTLENAKYESVSKDEQLHRQSEDEVQSQIDSVVKQSEKRSLDIGDKESQISELITLIEEEEQLNVTEGKDVQRERISFEKIETEYLDEHNATSLVIKDLEMHEDRLNKNNRMNKFKTQKERKEWFSKELEKKKPAIEMYSKSIKDLEAQKNILIKEIEEGERVILDENQVILEMEEEKITIFKKVANFKKQSLEKDLLKKEKYQERILAHHNLTQARDSLKEAEDLLLKRAGASSRQKIIGARSIEKVVEHLKKERIEPNVVKGAVGMFADCFECSQHFNTAVSAIAGSRLFNYVITSAHIATRLLHWKKTLNLPGQVDLMPLDKLRPYQNDNAVPPGTIRLLDELNFDAEYENVIGFVFGSFVLAKDNRQFRDIMQKKYDGITLDGDQTSRKGVITGGYYGDGSNNKYVLHQKVKESKVKLVELEKSLKVLERVVGELTTSHQKILEQIQDCQLKLDQKNQKNN